ncbi:MAG TPA: S-layer homology domain-containing protein, partial [Patescibacteria group bacterium]|nr:S-layer homology domain-containing protein [Patescibacteria group bacterium]
FAIGKNDFTDLEYTVKMDESAGNDMQGIKATVNFMVNVEQYSGNNEPGNGNGGNDDDDQLIEEPTEEIPSIGGTPIDYGKKYPDIKDHKYFDSIVELIEQGIVTGYPDGSIRPDNYITRLEAAALISRAMGLKGSDSPTPYKDKVPDWARGYVIELYEKGIMIGIDNNRFSPNTTITREEIATILTRLYKLNSEEETNVDLEDLDGWSIKYIKAVVRNKIMPSLEANRFKPKQKMTRAETMDFIYKAIKQMNLGL